MSITKLHREDVLTGEKKVGEVLIESVNDKRFATLYKYVDINTGKLRVPSGWATDQPHLSQLMITAANWEVDPDEARIILIEKSDNRQWLTTVSRFMVHGFHIDRGFGSQYALVDEHWDELVSRKTDYQLGLDLK